MSIALFEKEGLRCWEDEEIHIREHAVSLIYLNMRKLLQKINQMWAFKRIEGSCLMPCDLVSQEHLKERDVYVVGQEEVGVSVTYSSSPLVLRPETTKTSYLMAERYLKEGKAKLPLCIWQHGKSFRVESNDGARVSRLRFNEFYQLEFQCIYAIGTHANYSSIKDSLAPLLQDICLAKQVRVIECDRTPSYSEKTWDIEVFWHEMWMEVASISLRKDYSDDHKVLEIAIGTDRLVSIYSGNKSC